jgi:Cu+-exporting ATPase
VIEAMSKIDSMVFDKTGTITSNRQAEISYMGAELEERELSAIKTLLRSSNHPLSRMLYDDIDLKERGTLSNFKEIASKGIRGKVDDLQITLGSSSFVGTTENKSLDTVIHVKIDKDIKGKFVFKNAYRKGLKNTIASLEKSYEISILSGDNEGEKISLNKLFPKMDHVLFNQKPEDKLNFIRSKQELGKKIIMFGDGLNDAGALAQSNVGIAVSEDINVFSPACDGILDSSSFQSLPDFLRLTHKTMNVIKVSFIISFMYNIVGLLFAVTGNLSPIVAAILMPISSISVVLFATISTNILAKKILS